jgi:hypothetical protein
MIELGCNRFVCHGCRAQHRCCTFEQDFLGIGDARKGRHVYFNHLGALDRSFRTVFFWNASQLFNGEMLQHGLATQESAVLEELWVVSPLGSQPSSHPWHAAARACRNRTCHAAPCGCSTLKLPS